MKAFLTSVILSGLLLGSPADVYALCGTPQPRLVCAEAAHSQGVVIARVLSHRVHTDNPDADLNVYRLSTLKVLRGEMAGQFSVYEPNDSGRADFSWKVGGDYLLFLSRSPGGDGWTVEPCGNSGPMSGASGVLSKIKVMADDHSEPLLLGMVSTDSWTTGLPGADVVISGEGRVVRTRSDVNGRFALRVPAGTYEVTALLGGWSFQPGVLSFEDPQRVVLRTGTCAQVQLEGSRVGSDGKTKDR